MQTGTGLLREYLTTSLVNTNQKFDSTMVFQTQIDLFSRQPDTDVLKEDLKTALSQASLDSDQHLELDAVN